MTEGPQVGIGGLESPDYLRPTYANFVNVGHSPFDFRLTFALLKMPRPGVEAERAEADGVLHPEAVADIIIPVNVVQGLIAALREQHDAYLNQFGIPGFGPESQR